MRWLILIGNEKFDLNTIKSIKHYGCVNCYDVPNIAGRYCVDFGKDHIFYDYNAVFYFAKYFLKFQSFFISSLHFKEVAIPIIANIFNAVGGNQ